ncbi:tetratricopeptide repeat protein [Bombella sp. TMW 2.2543]|uniref:Tetratricopeptide repeat protein n=1 Tax=Bombella pluederhausensis TaxID=2967336 RepID=A0ABT3WE64_9PROT|nr:tetratricopeptide repeat protein [Bombella pluederhausensis]MCX5617251.1 tetratricopeptide repeat protein [Bombella pluederhausensis]
MRHYAWPVPGPVSAILKGALGVVLLSCTAIVASGPAWADDGLSREAIMKQHQALARQHDGGDEVFSDSDGQGDSVSSSSSLAPPVASSSSDGSRSVSSSGRSGGDLVANLLERVNALEGQVREMHGQMEQMSNQLRQDEANTSKQLGDMQFALENGHHTAARAVEAAPAPAAAATSSAEPAAAPHTAADALQAGRAALKSHQYETAESEARQALKQSKTGWSRTEAQYLLAQSLAGQKAYKNAALAYYDVYSHSPDSPRAPEALVGVSASMLALGNKTAACEALQRLHKEFPNASARVKSSEQIFRERASCH